MGLGYIGLPTASVLASNGFEVLGVDVSQHIVDTVNHGDIHIEEPGLHTVVQAAIQSGNLRAALEPEIADVFLLAVPTPLTREKQADMTYVRRAAESIVPYLKRGNLVILESTSPPGTCRELLKPILEASGLSIGEDIYLAYCPERVLPGKILKELITNDRIIGGYDVVSAERARSLYETFVEGELFLTDATTAETVKLLENTFRDVNIALANEAALLCERLGVDFWEVARFANRHPRVNVHQAGPGVGGHCISVDPWFLVEADPEAAQLIRLARERNDAMPEHVAETVQALLKDVEQPRIAALGLAYKGNVDDIRESPALRVVELLRARGVDVAAYDPHVQGASPMQRDFADCVCGADLLLVLTDHDEYRALNPRFVAEQVRTKRLYDTRNILDRAAWKEAGFAVYVLGARLP
ncbi:MAG: nucleotide sugar dehydrogenase [Candidatus Hydrogenedentes bacterium]|nr:nucleotide sugar dehydrogenase [Candidatus Hydrogenedentota bacterium]MBI3117130.1 nucleotide sugar dehydrogenase [Candidatus Hydrogenedentota bacterium]